MGWGGDGEGTAAGNQRHLRRERQVEVEEAEEGVVAEAEGGEAEPCRDELQREGSGS